MNFAVIGSGGREHAICYKLKQSPKIKRLICIPGNAGTQKIAVNINEDISNFKALYKIIIGILSGYSIGRVIQFRDFELADGNLTFRKLV